VETETTQIEFAGAAATDADLVRRLRQAEPAAYGELCDRFGAALHGFAASRLMGDQELAEDVMIQALSDAARNISRFSAGRSSLAAWVYGIARRKIEGEQRKLLRRKSVPAAAQRSIEELGEVVSGEDVAASVVEQVDARRKVAELEEMLSSLEMEVLVLHFVDGFSMKEVGQIVGRSAKAVDSLLHRATRRARERLVGTDG